MNRFVYIHCRTESNHCYLQQVRHADVSANAIGVFFGLGVALLLETISVYYSGPVFWVFFCTVGRLSCDVAMYSRKAGRRSTSW